MRIGIGYDIHRYTEDPPLVLGGVHFPDEPGLSGHSDADAVLHAIIDALLGAAGLGDIGRHFPPGDSAYAGADSRVLLRRTLEIVGNEGFRVENVDVTVIAERPRLAPHVPQMVLAIAQSMSVEPARVSVKATTNEGIGEIGRGEAIAAMAVALLAER